MEEKMEERRLGDLWHEESASKWCEDLHETRYSEEFVSRGDVEGLVQSLGETTHMKLLQRSVTLEEPDVSYMDYVIVFDDLSTQPAEQVDQLADQLADQHSHLALYWDWSEEEPSVRLSTKEIEETSWELKEERVGVSGAVKHRLSEVVGLVGFSFLLRNSEHIANYVWRGRWHSEQAVERLRLIKPRAPSEELCSKRLRGLAADSDDVLEINVVFYGKVSTGKSQLLRALLSQATNQVLDPSHFKISLVGGSTVAIKSYFYEQMTLHTDVDEKDLKQQSTQQRKKNDEQPSQNENENDEYASEVDGNETDGEENETLQRVSESTQTRKRARVVFWDTPGVGLKMPTGELGFEEIKKAIDAGVNLVDLCVFVFNGDGTEELYGPYMEMVKQICAKNGYKKGSPEYNRAARRVVLVRTHGDGFEWSEQTSLQEQFDKGFIPEDLKELRASIANKLNKRLENEGFQATIKPFDICHVSTRAFAPDYGSGERFEEMYKMKTYGIKSLLDRIFATATAEMSLILLEKHRREIVSVGSDIAKEMAFASAGGATVGLGVGGLAIGAYSVFQSAMAVAGVDAALGLVATTAVVGLPVAAGTMLGGLVGAAYKWKDIQRVWNLHTERSTMSNDVKIAGFDGETLKEGASEQTSVNDESAKQSD